MKSILIVFLVIGWLSCNNAEDEAGNSNNSEAVPGGNDTVGDTRGMRGTGADNSGGTPGPGTITESVNGKMDTADHTSRKDSIK